MKCIRSILLLALLWVSSEVLAETIHTGSDILKVTKAMKDAGFEKSGLELLPAKPTDRFLFWQVDEGVLIVSYSMKTQKVTHLSYWFCDERPKASRKIFVLKVIGFDTSSGEMKIVVKKEKND